MHDALEVVASVCTALPTRSQQFTTLLAQQCVSYCVRSHVAQDAVHGLRIHSIAP